MLGRVRTAGSVALLLLVALAQACHSGSSGTVAATAPPPSVQPTDGAPLDAPPSAPHPEAVPVGQPPEAAPDRDPGSAIDWELKAQPMAFPMARRSSFQLIVSATNRGTQKATPELYRAQLTVNGEPSMSFGLAFGNGVMESGWAGLQPGERVETRRDLGESLFPAPGEYVLVFTNGASRSTVKVRVTP